MLKCLEYWLPCSKPSISALLLNDCLCLYGVVAFKNNPPHSHYLSNKIRTILQVHFLQNGCKDHIKFM